MGLFSRTFLIRYQEHLAPVAEFSAAGRIRVYERDDQLFKCRAENYLAFAVPELLFSLPRRRPHQ